MKLFAPLAGWVVPLDAVPDPVFAGRMLGDGVAIDPTGDTLHAPCDGQVLTVHAARHAVTLLADDGGELLLHLGIDTVALGGDGITPLVAAGGRVRTGDPLLRFDLDRLVLAATAVVTPLVVTGGRVTVLACGLIASGDVLAEVTWGDAAGAEAAASDNRERDVVVALVHGVHARPAARIVAAAKGAAVTLIHDGREASAASAVALLGLGMGHGASVTVRASDPAVLDAVAAVLADTAPEDAPPPVPVPSGDGPGLPGIPAAAGIGVGTAYRRTARHRDIPVAGAGVAAETTALDAALTAEGDALAAEGGVMAAQGALLADPDLIAAIQARVGDGAHAAAAARGALEDAAAVLAASPDRRIAERAADLRDIAGRLVTRLLGEDAASAPIPAGSILIARDLLPSEVAALDPGIVAGIALAEGGPTSHAAILAAGKGIPMAVAFGAALDGIDDGATLLLDADRGRLEVEPALARIAAAQAAEAVSAADGPCRTADGTRIELFANLGAAADAEAAVAGGAEGCGLLRTEFLFLDRATAPDEDEQYAAYQAVADALDANTPNGRPLIVRLLDVGGDKPAPYLAIPREENPALGLRGIRVALARPEVLATQLRAIGRVTGDVRIMAPMVASVAELDAVADALARLGIDRPLGVMIETPAAAMTADLIARRAAFLSIGTNDLTQYALAMDRGNPAVAAGVDGLHPAVLRLIAATCEGAARHGRPVGVCGGLAADARAVPILIGLGVTELSVPPARLGAIRAVVAATNLAGARTLAQRALACASASDVRALGNDA